MQHSLRLVIYAITLLAGIAPVLVHAQGAEAETGSLVIRGGWLFDGVSDTRRRNSGILIREGKIAALDVAAEHHQLTPALASSDPRSAEMYEMVELMIKHQVYYDANLKMYGGINLREQYLADMVWAEEAKHFTPYAQKLLEQRGPPLPESDVPEFNQRVVEFMALYKAGPSKSRHRAAIPKTPGTRRITLATLDAHGLYEKYGFKPLAKPNIVLLPKVSS